MSIRPATALARAVWCGDRLTADGRLRLNRRDLRILADSGCMADPRYVWLPVTRTEADEQNRVLEKMGLAGRIPARIPYQGWNDEAVGTIRCQDGERRSPAEIAFTWIRSATRDARRWLYLMGPVGRGKSHLASVLGVHWVAVMDTTAKIVSWCDYVTKIQHAIRTGSSEYHVQELVDQGLLIVDDLDTGHVVTTSWALESLWNLLNNRIGRPTILTSNLKLSSYRARLVAAAKKGEDLETATRISDRLATGAGGNVFAEVPLLSPSSMRERR